MTGPLDTSRPIKEIEGLERQVAKLAKINRALMHRVEKSMDQQANAYSLFQTAISLEEQVRVRTEELKNALSSLERTNDELMSARDASERANRFKTRFFTAVGHDLLQPLQAARLSASALAETVREVDQERLANRIEHALTTIEDLLKSILDISKLEAGAITPSLQPISLEQLF
ncbi:MAG: histidine kinase dimerization/phospho-acceptor domain-containing protein, partial [Hyphomicrobium sp.]